jgi:signal peptidase I
LGRVECGWGKIFGRESAVESTVEERASINVFDYRKAARRRALVCPGAGWAFMGRPGFGRVTFGVTLAMLLVASYAAWRPSAGPAWTAAALLAAVVILLAVELFQTCVAWPKQQASVDEGGPGWRAHVIGAAVLTAAAVLLGAIVATSYRTIVIQGDGMLPTVSDGDRLLCRMGVDRRKLTAGRLILFHCSPKSIVTTVGDHVLGRIIAVPGDAIEIRDGIYYVNGVGVRRAGRRGSDQPALAIPNAPAPGQGARGGKEHIPARVPPDSYFIVQDSIERGRDSRVLSWVEVDHVKSCDIFSCDRGLFPRRLE